MSDYRGNYAVNIEEELKALSGLYDVGHCWPCAAGCRDGLKPVHRRVLYTPWNVLGNDWNETYKKSTRVVGDVIGTYGDSRCMTPSFTKRPFSLRYMLVDGQGQLRFY